MTKENKSFVAPVGLVFCIWAFSTIIYYNLRGVADPALGFYAGNITAFIMGFTLLIGPCILYWLLYRRGAGVKLRIFGSLLVNFAWMIKEVYRVMEYFTPAESIFYILSPVYTGLFAILIGLLGIIELTCRARSGVRVLTTGPVLAITFSLLGIALMRWGGGVHLFFFYTDCYMALFI